MAAPANTRDAPADSVGTSRSHRHQACASRRGGPNAARTTAGQANSAPRGRNSAPAKLGARFGVRAGRGGNREDGGGGGDDG